MYLICETLQKNCTTIVSHVKQMLNSDKRESQQYCLETFDYFSSGINRESNTISCCSTVKIYTKYTTYIYTICHLFPSISNNCDNLPSIESCKNRIFQFYFLIGIRVHMQIGLLPESFTYQYLSIFYKRYDILNAVLLLRLYSSKL